MTFDDDEEVKDRGEGGEGPRGGRRREEPKECEEEAEEDEGESDDGHGRDDDDGDNDGHEDTIFAYNAPWTTDSAIRGIFGHARRQLPC